MININNFIGGFFGCIILELIVLVVFATIQMYKDSQSKKVIKFPGPKGKG